MVVGKEYGYKGEGTRKFLHSDKTLLHLANYDGYITVYVNKFHRIKTHIH